QRSAAHLVPVLLRDAAAVGTGGDTHGAVVLLRAAHPVGEMRGGGDVVELRRRLVVLSGPGDAAVVGDVGPAVVALDHALRIVGRDPETVVVPVRRADRGEGPS